MANIQKELDKIKTALYGSEVRQSIHDALKAGNDQIEIYTDAELARQSAEQSRKTGETARQQAETHRQATNAQVEELIDNFKDSMVIANTTTAGLVKAGGDIAVTADGTVTVKKEVITNTIKSTVATASSPGSVKSAGDITVAADGTVTVKREVITNTIQSTVATAASPGAVKSGGDITVSADGTVSVKEAVINNLITASLKRIYPVGKIEITYNNTNPSAFLGFGTWEQFAKGQTLIGVNTADTDFNAAGKSGGEKQHTLTINEMPGHNHVINYGSDTEQPGYAVTVMSKGGFSSTAPILNTGGNQPHNNLPPYITVYFWRRTA